MEGNPLISPCNLLYKKNPLLLMQVFNTKATQLDISNAGIDHLPPFIGRLTDLVRLDLKNNLLSTLPTELGFLTQLKELILEGNPLQSPFDHLRREPYGDLAVVQFLHVEGGELDLTGASLVEIPVLLLRHSNKLTALNLSDNALKSLPKRFVELQALRILLLDNNLLRHVFFLPQKNSQIFYFNRFVFQREFPPEICQLVNLQVLTLDKNGIKRLPNSISALQNLQTFVLDSNKITCES